MSRITINSKEYETVLAKTLETLSHFGKTLNDIAWIGTVDGTCVIPLERFVAWANKALALCDWGNERIDQRICIVGTTGWWMTWHTYDGCEGWGFHQMPQLAARPVKANIKATKDDPFEPETPPAWHITHPRHCRTWPRQRGQRRRNKRFNAWQDRRVATRIRMNEKKYPKLAW